MKNTFVRKIKIVCENCNKEVIKSNKQKVCSMKCRGELKHKEFILSHVPERCPVCGEVKILFRKTKGISVCDNSCAGTMNSRLFREKNPDYYGSDQIKFWKENPKPMGKIPCKNCQTIFQQKRHNQLFCRPKCQDYWHSTFGNKAKNKIKKREISFSKIGCCALCFVTYADIRTPKELGMRSHNFRFMKDHIVPSSHNGSDKEENFRWLCWFCNMTRKDLPSHFDSAIAMVGKQFWAEIKRLISENPHFLIPNEVTNILDN